MTTPLKHFGITIIISISLLCNNIFAEALYDKYGQSTSVNFPQKVTNDEQLKQDIEFDKEFYTSFNPLELDSYGGLAGSKEKYNLEATGFFSVQKIGDRFVLVTPEGNMYFTLTVGGLMTYHTLMPVKGKEDNFEWLPAAEGKFRKAYSGKNNENFSFYVTNLIRKYGDFDYTQWKEDFVYRLRQLGFNSHNNYGDLPSISTDKKFPVTIVLQDVRHGDKDFIYGFFDPFNEDSRNRIDKKLKNLLIPYKDCPEILGYFIQNEPDFSFIPMSIPKLDGKYPAKQKLVERLREKYKTIDAFNKAWNLQAEDFNSLLEPIYAVTSEAGKDMNDYYAFFLDAYYKCVHDMIRKYDPNHLLLGSRTRVRDGRTDIVNQISGKYMDVLSINYYCYYFDKESMIRNYQHSGKPYILSEWCFDTHEQGLMSNLRNLENQTQRGKAYRNYVEQAASLPFVVGIQWWCMLDNQSYKVNTGLVNIADRPYTDFLREVAKTNNDIYSVITGDREAYSFDHPLFTQQKGKTQKIIDAPHAIEGSTVDGIQLPWPDRPSTRITTKDLVWGKESTENEADFWLCWDSDNLYLYIDVKDPTPRMNERKGRGIWGGDAIEIYLGPIKDEPGLLFSDRQLLIAAGKKTAPNFYWYNSPKQFPIEAVVKDSPTGQGYTIEVGIPFNAFGIEPKAGTEFMFDIALDEGKGTGRERQFVWNGTAENSTTHENWGRARLSE
ncbi:MAG: sugar-binding protein [Sedimentisphaeraceae bacterium JB056]